MPKHSPARFTYAFVLGGMLVYGGVACSSTTTGNGAGTGGTGKGLFGGGTSTGGTSGSTAGGGTATTVPTSCTAAAADDSCTACLKQSCCSSTVACAKDAECDAIFNCATNCTTQACTNACIQAHPNGQATLQVFVSCEQQSCVTPCGGSSSTSSGGTTTSGGTSGSSSTCTSSADQSVCANDTGHTSAVDCPGGPPSAQCFAAPVSGISNTYCCPP